MSQKNDPEALRKKEGVDVVDDLFKQAKKYIPPHERQRLLREQQSPAPASPSLSRWQDNDRGSRLTDSPSLNSSRGNWGGRDSPRLGEDRGSLTGSRGNLYDSRGGGSSKWNDRPSSAPTYGPDGLMPANSRLEAELFDKSNSGGLNFDKYEDIPVDVEQSPTTTKELPPGLTSFEDIDLGPVLAHNIKLSTFTNPTPVQKNAIPIVMAGRDLMACAQTGSGKTCAFLFPVIADLVKTEQNTPPPQPGYRRSLKICPQALVLAPTRELAVQIHQEARKFTYRSHLRSVVVYGGAEFRTQLSELERGCNILVATPGRLLDMIQRGKLGIDQIRYLCIDEADRMLDMGFEQQIRDIVAECPGTEFRQTLMFSATFPKTIQRLAEDFLFDYVFLTIGRIGSTTDLIIQRVKYVEEHEKKEMLLELLPTIPGLTIVFCETKRMADHLEEYLYHQGFGAASIHGDRSQKERELALEAFKSGKVQVLVATDVAARGLDVHAVKHVVNFDMPNDIDDYVHRIGRTGRGIEGVATAFFNEKNNNIANDLVHLMEESGQEIEAWLRDTSNRYANRGTRPRRGGPGGAKRGGYSPRGSYAAGSPSRGGNYFISSGNTGGNYGSGGSGKEWW